MKLYNSSKIYKSIFEVITVWALLNSFQIEHVNAEDANEKTDCDYLKEMLKKLNSNATWKDNTNDCCNSVNGVICNASRIIKLKFDKRSIYGQLPEEIGQLTMLQSLNLNNNKLYGIIPKSIGKLTNLEELYLNNNDLSGEIPREVESLEKLTTIDLGNNGLYNYIPEEIGSLRSLQNINLQNNNLSGAIPISLSYLKNLKNINLSGNNNLQGAIPPLEYVTICDYGKTGLCIPKDLNDIKCKSQLTKCSDEEEKNTGILRNRQKMKKIDEEAEEENNNITNGSKYMFGLNNLVLLLIVGFIIIAILLFFILKKYINYRYDSKLQKNMNQRQYFINHSLKKNRNNNNSNNSNGNNNDITNDIQITSNCHELEVAASQQSNNTGSSQDNYRPIYPDNLSDVELDKSSVTPQMTSSQIIQIPSLTYSPQNHSIIPAQLINNTDVIKIDPGNGTDNLVNYNSNRSSMIFTNSNSLHSTRSLRNNPRRHSIHSPIITGLTPINPTNRYSIGSGINNYHNIGIYSNGNTIITNYNGNDSWNNQSQSRTDETSQSRTEETSHHENDGNEFINTTYNTENNNSNNKKNNSHIDKKNSNYNNTKEYLSLNLNSNSVHSSVNSIARSYTNDSSSLIIPQKSNDSDFISVDEISSTNLDKIHNNNENEVVNDSIYTKTEKDKINKIEETLSMSLSVSSKKIDSESDDNESKSGNSTTVEISKNKHNKNSYGDHNNNNNNNNNNHNDDNDDNDTSDDTSDGSHISIVIKNNRKNKSKNIIHNGLTESNNNSIEQSKDSLPLHPKETNGLETLTSISSSSPNTQNKLIDHRKLNKEELAKRESSYIKAHKRKIPVLVDRHRSLVINSVSGGNDLQRRGSLPYNHHRLSLASNRNSLSMTNLVQLNSYPNSYIGFTLPQNINSNDVHLYEASSSNNFTQPRNNILFRTDSGFRPIQRESNRSNRSKHLSMIIPKKNQSNLYLGDETTNSHAYSGSFINSIGPSSSLVITPLITNSPTRTSNGQQFNNNDRQKLQVDVQDGYDHSLNNDVSEVTGRTNSSTNISNLLRMANDDNNISNIEINSSPTTNNTNNKSQIDSDNTNTTNTNTKTNTNTNTLSTTNNNNNSNKNNYERNDGNINNHNNINKKIHRQSLSSTVVDPINIYHSNVASPPIGAISINGVTYIPATQGIQSSNIASFNVQPVNGTNIINVNYPSVHINTNEGNISPSASPVSSVIQSPLLGTSTGIIINNSANPYNYSINCLSSEVSSNPNSVSALNHSEISNNSYQPTSPHLFTQPLNIKGEIIHVDDNNNMITDINHNINSNNNTNNTNSNNNNDNNSNNNNDTNNNSNNNHNHNNHNNNNNSTDSVNPEIVFNNTTVGRENSGNVHLSVNQNINSNTNRTVNYVNNETLSNNNNLQDNAIYYNEVIEVPNDEMMNQILTYNGYLNESTTNQLIDNGQYVTYNYSAPEEEVVTEHELYYEEIDPDEEAPPPYSDTYDIN